MKRFFFSVLFVALVLLLLWYFDVFPLSLKATPYESFERENVVVTHTASLDDVTGFKPVEGLIFGDSSGHVEAGFDGTTYHMLITAYGLAEPPSGYGYRVWLLRTVAAGKTEDRADIGYLDEKYSLETDDRGSRRILYYSSPTDYRDHDVLLVTLARIGEDSEKESIILQGDFRE